MANGLADVISTIAFHISVQADKKNPLDVDLNQIVRLISHEIMNKALHMKTLDTLENIRISANQALLELERKNPNHERLRDLLWEITHKHLGGASK